MMNDGENEDIMVTVYPDVPRCLNSGGHEWERPWDIVGGSKSSPGVWSLNAEEIIHEVCMYCGTERITETWAPAGQSGLTLITYHADKYRESI